MTCSRCGFTVPDVIVSLADDSTRQEAQCEDAWLCAIRKVERERGE